VLEQRVEALLARVAGLESALTARDAENAELRAENAELRRRPWVDSSRSSRPPSSDAPSET